MPGNFHIATHALPQEALRSVMSVGGDMTVRSWSVCPAHVQAFGGGRVDMEHTIHHLSISDPEEDDKQSWRHQWALTKLQVGQGEASRYPSPCALLSFFIRIASHWTTFGRHLHTHSR